MRTVVLTNHSLNVASTRNEQERREIGKYNIRSSAPGDWKARGGLVHENFSDCNVHSAWTLSPDPPNSPSQKVGLIKQPFM